MTYGLLSIKEIKGLFKKYRLWPSKRLGQNFLVNQGVLKRIIEESKILPKDIILEIGPGVGTLTQELAKRAKEVIAVEKDPKMAEILKETTKNFKNVKIIQADILKLNPIPYARKPCKIIANLPYYIASPLIRRFLEAKNQPKEMVLMVQKEVAQRICSKPPDMTLLAVSVQFYAYPKILFYVKKGSFWPKPKVDGAVIKIVSRKFRVRVSRRFSEQFFRIVRAGFSQPRKQILNNLSKNLKIDREKVKEWLKKNKINPTQRAETLNLEDWNSLTKSFYS